MAISVRYTVLSSRSGLGQWAKRRIFALKCEYIENRLNDYLWYYQNFDGSDRSLHFKMVIRAI